MTTVAAALLAALSALLLILCFPPAGFAILAWIALVPLLLAVRGATPVRAYLLGAGTGLLFFPGFFHWIWAVRGFNFVDSVLLEAYFAQYAGLFALLLVLVTARTRLPVAVAAPVLWVALEYVRGNFFFLALPMGFLGHSQYRELPLVQLVSITGVYGISFLIVAVNALVADALSILLAPPAAFRRSRALARLGVAAACLLVPTVYGRAALAEEPAGSGIRVGVVQRNLPPESSWDSGQQSEIVARYLELTRDAAADGPQLIVWPETALPGPLHTSPDLAAITSLATTTGSYLLIGSAASQKLAASNGAPRHEQFNSALLISPGGRLTGAYHKIRLVPFGEYTPLEGIVAWPSWIVSGSSRLTPGRSHTLFRVPGARFGVVICWETIFPDLFRALARQAPDFMVNLTNEAWFGGTVASRHLLAISAFRAAEHRLPLVRSANGGVSSFIDLHGRILVEVPAGDGTAVRAVPLSARRTFYTAWGDVFAHLCLGGAAGLTGWALVQRQARSTRR
jgi:apolipoprotein N-acyltransferase